MDKETNKKDNLIKLSSIIKGLIIYKKEIKELQKLIDKYPEYLANYNVAHC